MSKKSHFQIKKEDQFCESYWKKNQFRESHSYLKIHFGSHSSKKGLNSLSLLMIFLKWVKELNPFWIWLKELTFFSKRIWLKELNFSFWIWRTQRIELFLNMTRKNWTSVLSMIQRIESLSEYDSKNRTFFLNTTQWIEPIFLNVTQIEIFGWKIVKKNSKLIFFTWPEESNPLFSIWLKELNLFRLVSKIWCYSVWNKELNFFLLGLTELDPFSWIWLRELNFSWVFYMSTFFKNDAENWTLLSLNVTSRIWTFLEYDAKNWTLFLFDAKKWTFISLIWMTPRIVFFKQKNLNELNFLKYDSQNWTFEPCVKKIKKDSENGTLLKWFFEMTHRMEPFFFWTFSRWLKELKSFFNMTQRIEPFVFLKMSQRIELKKMLKELNICFIWTTFLHDSMNWFFSQFDSKSWVFSNMTQRVGFFFWISLEELNIFFYHDSKELNLSLFLNFTQRLEPSFEYDSQKWAFFFFEHDSKKWTFLHITQRIEPFFLRGRRKELNFFLNLTQRIDAKNWTSFLNMIQRIEFLSDIYDSKSKNRTFFFLQYDSTNRTLFLHVIHVFKWFKEFFFKKFLKELIFHMTQRMVPDAKTWNLCFWNLIQRIGPFLWLKELNPFFVWRKELNFFSDLPQRTELFFFSKIWLELSHFFLIGLKELNYFYDLQNWTSFFFTNMTQRIEPFLLWLRELIFLRLKELNFSSSMAQRIEFFCLVWVKELVFS